MQYSYEGKNSHNQLMHISVLQNKKKNKQKKEKQNFIMLHALKKIQMIKKTKKPHKWKFINYLITWLFQKGNLIFSNKNVWVSKNEHAY